MEDNERMSTADLAGSEPAGTPNGEESRSRETPGGSSAMPTQAPETVSLISPDVRGDFTRRWEDIQVRFVDDPQHSVQEADALVAEIMQHLAQIFADEKSNLEARWSRGGDASTEDLRMAIQHYRSLVDRLLRA